MEIHAPGGHVQSVRDILLHLAIVTAGILIALGLEQTVEWYHNRKLAGEARENILSEIRDNKKELDKQVTLLPGFRSAAVEALDFITDIQQKGKSDIQSLHLSLYQAQLHSNKYAAAYHMQDQYLGSQDRTEAAGVNAYSVFSARNKLEKLSATELESERAKLMIMISALTVEIQDSRGLSRAYCGVISCDTSPGKPEPGKPEPGKPEGK